MKISLFSYLNTITKENILFFVASSLDSFVFPPDDFEDNDMTPRKREEKCNKFDL